MAAMPVGFGQSALASRLWPDNALCRSPLGNTGSSHLRHGALTEARFPNRRLGPFRGLSKPRWIRRPWNEREPMTGFRAQKNQNLSVLVSSMFG